MILMLVGLLGGLMNRIRGGLWGIHKSGTINAVVFGVLAGLLTASVLNGVLAIVGMLLGQSLGWGRYIGALGGWENKRLEEVKLIDHILSPLAPTPTEVSENRFEYKDKFKLMLWGFLGLSLRGFVWSLAIILPLAFVNELDRLLVVFAGLLMPLCYKIPQMILQKLGLPDKVMWEIGEVIFGFVLWYSSFYFLLGV